MGSGSNFGVRKVHDFAHYLRKYAQMIRWDDLRILVELNRSGSLSETARRLGTRHSTISRRIDTLETSLGARLFDRTAKGYVPTPLGEKIAGEGQRLEDIAFSIERLARGESDFVTGNLRITAPPVLASFWIAPRLTPLLRENRGLHIELLGESSAANLSRREADIAVRLRLPADGNLRARRAGVLAFGLYGARTYLSETPSAEYSFCGYDEKLAGVPQEIYLDRASAGRPVVFRANSLASLHAAVSSGVGLAVLPHFLARDNPELQCIEDALDAWRDIWLLAHPDVTRSAAVRTTLDFLTQVLADLPG